MATKLASSFVPSHVKHHRLALVRHRPMAEPHARIEQINSIKVIEFKLCTNPALGLFALHISSDFYDATVRSGAELQSNVCMTFRSLKLHYLDK